MKCTEKEQQSCRVEKRGCEGCFYDDIQERINIAKRQLRIKDEYLKLILDIACDYDGLNTVDSLKGLIDDLMDYARGALTNNTTDEIYTSANGKKFNILHEEIKEGE